MQPNIEANRLIDALGGTGVVAGLCEVTTGAVSQWRTEGIPKARLMYLRVIRPDIFAAQRAAQKKKARAQCIDVGDEGRR